MFKTVKKVKQVKSNVSTQDNMSVQRKLNVKTIGLGVALSATVLQLCSCAAISTAMNHGSLTTQSKMSETIFLDPVSAQDKVIYVQVRDTTGQKIDLTKDLTHALTEKGWTVTDNVDKAHDMIQVNVLQAGKADNPQAVWNSMHAGFGSAMLGGLSGLSVGLASSSVGAGVGTGLAVGAASYIADSLVKDVTYSMITDVQVSVRTNGEVTQTTKANLAQGNSTSTTQTYHQKTNWMRYRTRIASIADQVNLDFDDAKPVLQKEVASEIAGMMG